MWENFLGDAFVSRSSYETELSNVSCPLGAAMLLLIAYKTRESGCKLKTKILLPSVSVPPQQIIIGRFSVCI